MKELKRVWEYNGNENILNEKNKKKFCCETKCFWKVIYVQTWIISNKLVSSLLFALLLLKYSTIHLNFFLKVLFRRHIKANNLNKFRETKIPLYYWLYHYLRWNKEFLAESPHYHCSQDLIIQCCCFLVKSLKWFKMDSTLTLDKPTWKRMRSSSNSYYHINSCTAIFFGMKAMPYIEFWPFNLPWSKNWRTFLNI